MLHHMSSRRFILWLVAAVMLLAVNLRAPIIAVGPLAAFIQNDLHINSTMMGVIAALPVLSFAAFSPFAAGLGKRFGMEEVLIGALAVLACGILLRTAGDSLVYMLTGTVMLSAGIAMGNVLLSGIIKRSLPLSVGRVTSFYSVTMGLAAGIAAAVAIPLAQSQGWRAALNIWLWPALAALALWLYMRKRNGHIATPVAAGQTKVKLWHSGLAWMISLMMGLQSLFYYTFSTWLPLILMSKGIAPSETGYYLLTLQLAGLPAVFITAALAAKVKKEHQQWLALCLCGMNVITTLALWLLSGGLLFWVGMIGVGASATFTLCLLFFVARTDTAEEAAGLSGMAQSVGYLVAALGPIGAGWLFDLTRSWSAPLAVMSILMAVKTFLGWYCARPVTLRQSQMIVAAKKGQ